MQSETPGSTLPFNKALYLFYGSGIIVVGGGFVLYTSGGDLRVGSDATAGSLVSQVILGFYYLVASLLFVSSPNFTRVVRVAWPVLILPCLAIISALWSPDPTLTLRRAFAFSGTVLFGLSLASAYQYRDCTVVICRALVAAMVLSVGVIVFDPSYGVHQAYDAVQAVHAGSWRGIFAHRNTLGMWAGATLAILVVIGRDALGTMFWVCAVAVTIACLAYTGSSTGIVIAALFILGHVAVTYVVRQPPSLRLPSVLFAILLVLSIAIFWNEVMAIILSLLGRQSDLSGRTLIWYHILQLLQGSDQPLGLGYFVGTVLLDERLSAGGAARFVNTHNGYLEAFVYFGYLGVIVSVFVVLWLLVRSINYMFLLHRSSGEIRSIPVLFVLMVAVHNLVESTIVSPNNLDTLLLAAAAGMVVVTPLAARTDRQVSQSRELASDVV